MTFNIILNKSSFLNTHPPFNGVRFEIWKAGFRIFIQSINSKLWETIIIGRFILSHQIDGEVVEKLDSLWIVEEKRKFQIDLKIKNVLIMSLDDSKLFMFIIAKPP